jgi:hypothetical protein
VRLACYELEDLTDTFRGGILIVTGIDREQLENDIRATRYDGMDIGESTTAVDGNSDLP